MRSRKPLLACLLGVALAVPALAQSGSSVTQYPGCPDPPPKLSPAEVEAAHASYKVGVEAYNRGDYQKALDNFREAFRRDCSKVALLNFISRAYEGLGNKPEAIHALEVYLQRNPRAEDAEDIQTRIKNLKSQVGSTSTATATVTATVTATATATETAAPTATATVAPTATGEVRTHGAAPWVVVGVGAAAAIAGGVMIAVGQGKLDDAHANCTVNVADPSHPNCPTLPGINDIDQSNKQRTDWQSQGNVVRGVGIAVAAVGVAAIAGGIIWHFVEPTGPKTSASLVPVFAPGYAGLSMSGQF
ncbi:MAG TPA: hypothetical protein VGH28_11890 [Polyangiaceae bacterium]